MLQKLSRQIIRCEACPRLRSHCLEIAQTKRRSFQDEKYWGKPITGFGDPDARLLIVGLAPAAHGANRTGRIFTGDRSGDWLFRALHRADFANQAHATDRHDGLTLKDVYVTCVVKCAPPDNKPLPDEVQRCTTYLAQELEYLSNVQVILALGQIALNGVWPLLKARMNEKLPKPEFKHGASYSLPTGQQLILSYHPSQQNTFTGRLTEEMFDYVFKLARKNLRKR